MKIIKNNSDFIDSIKMWFSDNQKCIKTYGHISDWDVSNVDEMAYAFYNKKEFNDNITRWNVSNVTNMFCMFEGAESFNQNISIWNTHKLNNTRYMFQNASSFNKNLSSWNTSHISINKNNIVSEYNNPYSFIYMMFNNCSILEHHKLTFN